MHLCGEHLDPDPIGPTDHPLSDYYCYECEASAMVNQGRI